MIQRKQTNPNILLASFIDLEYKHTKKEQTNIQTKIKKCTLAVLFAILGVRPCWFYFIFFIFFLLFCFVLFLFVCLFVLDCSKGFQSPYLLSSVKFIAGGAQHIFEMCYFLCCSSTPNSFLVVHDTTLC